MWAIFLKLKLQSIELFFLIPFLLPQSKNAEEFPNQSRLEI